MSGAVRDWPTRLARELRAAKRLFVLGVGNPDRADDGAGNLCVRLIRRGFAHSPLFGCRGEKNTEAKPSQCSSVGSLYCFAPRRDARLDIGASPRMKNLSIKARSLGGSGEKPSIINRRRLEEIGVLEGGEVPESVTGLIREFRPTHVLIIDAASAGHEPGTIFFIDKKKIVDEDITTHRIPLSRLVRYLEASIGCRVVLVGIEPADTGWGGSMSPAVREAAAALADQLAGLIQRWSRPSPYT